MLGVFSFRAIFTISEGETSWPSILLAKNGIWEIFQFWQLAHLKLQPTVAIDREWVPGRK